MAGAFQSSTAQPTRGQPRSTAIRATSASSMRPMPHPRAARRAPPSPRSPRGPFPPRLPRSLADDLDEHALLAPPVELAVENLLPRPEIELPLRHRHDHLPSHDLALEVRVGVVLAGLVVAVLGDGRVGRQALEPRLVVVVEPRLV